MLFVGLQESTWGSKAAAKVDDLLESFVGIRDVELGQWSLSKLLSFSVHSTLPHPGTSVSEDARNSESSVTRNLVYPRIQI